MSADHRKLMRQYRKLASSPQLSAEIADRILRSWNRGLARRLAANPACPVHVLREVANHAPREACRNPTFNTMLLVDPSTAHGLNNLTLLQMVRVREAPDAIISTALARAPLWSRLLMDQDISIADHPGLSPATLASLPAMTGVQLRATGMHACHGADVWAIIEFLKPYCRKLRGDPPSISLSAMAAMSALEMYSGSCTTAAAAICASGAQFCVIALLRHRRLSHKVISMLVTTIAREWLSDSVRNDRSWSVRCKARTKTGARRAVEDLRRKGQLGTLLPEVQSTLPDALRSPPIVARLAAAHDGSPVIRFLLLSSPYCPPAMLERKSRKGPWPLRLAVAANPCLHPSVRARLADDRNQLVRTVAARPTPVPTKVTPISLDELSATRPGTTSVRNMLKKVCVIEARQVFLAKSDR